MTSGGAPGTGAAAGKGEERGGEGGGFSWRVETDHSELPLSAHLKV